VPNAFNHAWVVNTSKWFFASPFETEPVDMFFLLL
jgi:hypothetical protein